MIANINFSSTEQMLKDQDIIDFENEFNLKLPEEFIFHYKINNGGYPNANWSEGEELNCPIEYFLPIKYGEKTIEKKLQEFVDMEFDYGSKIIFASRGMSYTYYIDLSKEKYGQIFIRKPKIMDIKTGNWEYHCANFKEFIKGLNQINYKPR